MTRALLPHMQPRVNGLIRKAHQTLRYIDLTNARLRSLMRRDGSPVRAHRLLREIDDLDFDLGRTLQEIYVLTGNQSLAEIAEHQHRVQQHNPRVSGQIQ